MRTVEVQTSYIPAHGTVGDVVRKRSCLRFYPKDKVTDIIKAMHGHHLGAAAVVEPTGRFVGLITEREILRRLFGMLPETAEQERFAEENKELGDLTAWDIMIASPVCLYEDTSIEEALDQITLHGYRYMPVVEAGDRGRLCGIVGERELFSYAQARARRELDAKDSLLSYLMHHELYGIGGVVS